MRIVSALAILLLVFACNNQANKKEDTKDSSVGDLPVKREELPQNRDTIFTGFGNEPFWAVYVINNDRIVFHPMDGSDVTVPFLPVINQDSVTQKYASSTDNHEIVLIITKKPCSDGMSDMTHEYGVDLMVNATHYSGCGRIGK
jgi:uncharacterized membrane protein